MTLLAKSYPTLDCDAHVTELPEQWDYMSEKERDFVRQWFWHDGPDLVVNGNRVTAGSWGSRYGEPGSRVAGRARVSGIEVAGPGINKKIIRKLYHMDLTDEQVEQTESQGARDPRARLKDMDYMGIDQVVAIPLHMFTVFLWVANYDAANIVCRAYNDWIYNWCSADPKRLFPAAAIPLQYPKHAATELHRVAKMDFKVALVRPVDIQGRYPNQPSMDPVWRAFEETGLVVGMHTLPYNPAKDMPTGPTRQWTVSQVTHRVVNPKQIGLPAIPQGFLAEAQVWLASVLLSGFLERYRGIRAMAMMECNSTWLPMLLEQLDKAFHLYRNERAARLSQLPSETFRERCFIAFEGDETPVYRGHQYFEDLSVWSSDVYHFDGADAWTAIEEMRKIGVPSPTEAKLMGGNARRMYRIEIPRTHLTRQQPPPQRPDWFPRIEDVLKEYAPLMVER